MPNPKRRHSRTRRDKRRTHDRMAIATISIDPATGAPHARHRAHYYEGELYYKGKKILAKGE